jgi:hypothetical protein
MRIVFLRWGVVGWQANNGTTDSRPLWVLQEYHACWEGQPEEDWRPDLGKAKLSGDSGLLMVGKALRDRKDTYSNSNMYLLIYVSHYSYMCLPVLIRT